VLVCAGPWTPEVIDPTRAWRPIVPVWGVVVELTMPDPPRHVIEQAGVEDVARGAEQGGGAPRSLFSLVARDDQAWVGSTFLADEPDPVAWVPPLRHAAEAYVPGLATARVDGVRACARPLSLDGRPLVGAAGGLDDLWVAAGHGPWGISTGPATARLTADAVLGRGEVPAALRAARFA
jgi:glycine/D-amino acid oxidase-like deaminating enzyme